MVKTVTRLKTASGPILTRTYSRKRKQISGTRRIKVIIINNNITTTTTAVSDHGYGSSTHNLHTSINDTQMINHNSMYNLLKRWQMALNHVMINR